MKTRPPEIIVTQQKITPRTIKLAFDEWVSQKDRFDVLYDYYIGDHDFGIERVSSNRITANFCAYIVKALRGYMVGNRPRYVCEDGDAYAHQVLDIMAKQDKWTVDSQIALDMSRYGKAYELVYLPEGKDEPHSTVVSPKHAFVAYTGDMERDSVFGAVIYTYTDDANREIYHMYMYTRTDVQEWESLVGETSAEWKPITDPVPHGFGRVPLIEYRNNEEFLGDFEGIMDLQDAYNALLSDRQDDKDAFAQSMLFIQGSIIGATPDELEDGKAFLKKHRILQGDEDTVASWLIKTMDESGIQILQDQYADAIHKFAMVPDLSDEQFSGNASGIAMAYKLFGTDQMMAEKATRFRQGFRRRFKLYDHRLHNPSNVPGWTSQTDISTVDIIFHYNAPQDLSYMATALSTLTGAGIMSKATARLQLASIPDPDEEAELVDEEAQATADAMASSFEDDFTGSLDRATEEDDDEDEERP